MSRWVPNDDRPPRCRNCGGEYLDHYILALRECIARGYYPCPLTPRTIDVVESL